MNFWALHMCRRVSFVIEDTIWEVLSNLDDLIQRSHFSESIKQFHIFVFLVSQLSGHSRDTVVLIVG